MVNRISFEPMMPYSLLCVLMKNEDATSREECWVCEMVNYFPLHASAMVSSPCGHSGMDFI